MQRNSKKTQAEKKAYTYVMDFFESDYFTKNIAKLRKKYSIPSHGFEPTDKDKETVKHNLWYLPETMLTEEGVNRDTLAMSISLAVSKIHKEKVEQIFFGLQSACLYFLFFDNFSDQVQLALSGNLETNNIITIRDLKMDNDEGVLEYCQEVFEKQPIAILLYPHTTKRDLLNFVELKWNDIENRLKVYRTKKSSLTNIKIKKDSSRKRDNILFKNKDKKIKELSGILGKEKIFMDQGNIANTLKRVKQKRKKV